MGKIKKILENELGSTQSVEVYPVTSIAAVYDENNERLDNIIKEIYSSTPTVANSSTESDLDISDEDGNVLAEFKGGHVRTKNFDSRDLGKQLEIDLSTDPNLVKKEVVFDAKLNGAETLPDVFNTNTGWVLGSNKVSNINNSVLWLKPNITLNEKETIAEFSLDTDDARFALCWTAQGGYNLCGSYFSVTKDSFCMHYSSSNGTMTEIMLSKAISLIIGRRYIFKAIKSLHENIIVLIDGVTGEDIAKLESVQTARSGGNAEFPGGRQINISGVKAETGTISLYRYTVRTMIAEPLVIVYGDSITEGDRCYSKETYGYLMKKSLGYHKVALSGFSGSQISSVISRIQSEIPPMSKKPKYIMVSIGTNGGNTQELFNNLKALIESYGCIPIINVPSGAPAKNMILSLGCLSTRFDIATSINNAEDASKDSSLFYDGIHPNPKGNQKMFDRMKVDLRELFSE